MKTLIYWRLLIVFLLGTHTSGVLLCFLWRAGLFIKSPFTFLRISSIILVRRYRRRCKVPANRKLRGCIFMKLRKVKTIAKSLLGIFSALMALMLLTYNAVFGYIAIAVMCLYGILVAAFWRCPKCRKNLGPLYVKYCPICGEKLNWQLPACQAGRSWTWRS